MGKRRYTHASILAQGQAFLAQHGRLPVRGDCAPDGGWPHYKTVLLLFGTWEQFQAAILGVNETRQRRCLRCEQEFVSQGRGNRICGVCKLTQDWQDEAQWLGREPINLRAAFRGRFLHHGTPSHTERELYERSDE